MMVVREPTREAMKTRAHLDTDDALELIHYGFREVTLEPDRALARRGLGRVHHRVLYFCRRIPGLSVGELVHVLGITKQALHRPLTDLAHGGFLVAEADPLDRRARRLRLTSRGLTLEDHVSGLQRAAFARAFAEVGGEAAVTWCEVMSHLGHGKTARSLRDELRGKGAADEPGAGRKGAKPRKVASRAQPERRRP